MNISPIIIVYSHIEVNSKTLFRTFEETLLLLKEEGRDLEMNRAAAATEGFAVITRSSGLSFYFISRKKETEFA